MYCDHVIHYLYRTSVQSLPIDESLFEHQTTVHLEQPHPPNQEQPHPLDQNLQHPSNQVESNRNQPCALNQEQPHPLNGNLCMKYKQKIH